MKYLFLVLISVVVFSVAGQDPRCVLPITSGHCRAYFQRYGYDEEIKQCVEFVYGGCGGNLNQFDLIEDCEETCLKQPEN